MISKCMLRYNRARSGFVGVSQINARVAELVDALALGASGATRESSSLSFRTRLKNTDAKHVNQL